MPAQCSMTPQCHIESVNVMSKQIEVATVTPNSVTSLWQSASGVSHLRREKSKTLTLYFSPQDCLSKQGWDHIQKIQPVRVYDPTQLTLWSVRTFS